MTADTTRIVSDRFAKIAASYTRGFVQIRYDGGRCETDLKQTIWLPANLDKLTAPDPGAMVDEASRREEIARASKVEDLTWGFVSHEMGHIEVERLLAADKRRRLTTKNAREIYDAIPEGVREFGVQPGHRMFTITALPAVLDRCCRGFADEYGDGLNEDQVASAARSQLKALVNAIEDPRMESMVGRRWAGAKAHLKRLGETSYETWKTRAAELDDSFFAFSVAVIFALDSAQTDIFGPVTSRRLGAVIDLVELYREKADWTTHHGFYDSVNLALAILARMFEVGASQGEEGEPERVPDPSDDTKLKVGMTVRVNATGQRATITAINEDGSIEAEAVT